MLLLSCADTCRVCADMLDRCVELEGQVGIGTMALTMSEVCAKICTTTAEACWATSGNIRELDSLLRECARQCRALSPEITVAT